jgi:hypothetical protein
MRQGPKKTPHKRSSLTIETSHGSYKPLKLDQDGAECTAAGEMGVPEHAVDPEGY